MRSVSATFVLFVLMVGQAEAQFFLTFTNRVDWEAAATLAGLDIQTEPFYLGDAAHLRMPITGLPTSDPGVRSTSEPSVYLSSEASGYFPLGTTMWDVHGGMYDISAEALVHAGDNDLGLALAEIYDPVRVLGFGFDSSTPGSQITVRDNKNNVFRHTFMDHAGFVGVIATNPLTPGEPYNARVEYDGPTSIDNLSMAFRMQDAVAVPEPSSIIVWSLVGLVVCIVWRVERWRALRYGTADVKGSTKDNRSLP